MVTPLAFRNRILYTMDLGLKVWAENVLKLNFINIQQCHVCLLAKLLKSDISNSIRNICHFTALRYDHCTSPNTHDT